MIKYNKCNKCGVLFQFFKNNDKSKGFRYRLHCLECVPYKTQKTRNLDASNLTKKCEKCLNDFKIFNNINGKRVRLRPDRKYCLECCPHNSDKFYLLRKDYKLIKENEFFECKECNKTLLVNNENFIINQYDKNNKFHKTCRSCLNLKNKERRKKQKEWCVNYKGGKCQICGYSKCIAALDFHHIDPSKKTLNLGITINSSFKKDIELIKTELDNCILLCSNCHREQHNQY